MSYEKVFTKEKLDGYLREVAKEYRRMTGNKASAEIILIGGASVLINYGFRETTYDVDAVISSSGAMKEAINIVGDRMNLPTGWLNTDFMKTSSYTPKLVAHSKYYKTFCNVVQVRTVSAEYLVAMKLMAGRTYKNDRSDILGILYEQEERGDKLTINRIKKAADDLYGDYGMIPENSRQFLELVFSKTDIKELYWQCKSEEAENRDTLISFENHYPGVLDQKNLSDILKAIKEKKQKTEEQGT